MIAGFGLSLILAIALCVHAVRTGQQPFWLWVILLLQPLGPLVYIAAIILPGIMGGTTARKFASAARETLDPHREYREAKAALDDAPTVRHQSRLAAAAAGLGRFDEAEQLYAQAAQGIHADDPALLLGRAIALIELSRPAEALVVLERLEPSGRTAAATLALARAYEALDRRAEAEAAFQSAVQRLPGLEALGRHAAFMARNGRRAEAQEALTEMDKRLSKTNPQFRREGRIWRDLAAQALGRA